MLYRLEYRTVFSRNDFIAANFFGVICRNYIIVCEKKLTISFQSVPQNFRVIFGTITTKNYITFNWRTSYIYRNYIVVLCAALGFSTNCQPPAQSFFFLQKIQFVETILNELRFTINICIKALHFIFFIFVKVFKMIIYIYSRKNEKSE